MRKSSTRKLNTKVFFYGYIPKDGPYPGEETQSLLYKSRAEIYDPSIKDLEVLNGIEAKLAVTLIIRNPGKKYIPSNKHFAKIFDYRYEKYTWNIVEVRPDIARNEFVTILLAVIDNE
ncbi:phage head-tail adapter protein [Enterococcus hirae]|nr:phage head-tail adapter protein [Enterococcus hirae]